MKIRQALAALGATFLLATLAHAQAVTALRYQSEPGDILGQGATVLLQAPADAVTIQKSNGWLQVSFNPAAPDGGVSVSLQGPREGPLAVGPYEGALTVGRAAPIVNFFRPAGTSCHRVEGRFVIIEITQTTNELQSLAANFQLQCVDPAYSGGGLPPLLHGELRVNSSIPFSHQEPAGQTAPDAFAFRAKTLVTPSSVWVSNEIVVNGINAPSVISVTGGEYSVDGGPFTSTTGFVANHQRVRVRNTASTGNGVTTSTVLSIGGVSVPFNVTTFQSGAVATALYVRSFQGAGATMLKNDAEAWFRPTAFGSVDIQMDYDDGAFGSLSLSRPNSSPGLPGVGPYEDAARDPFNGGSPGLDFSHVFLNIGCNTLGGRFVILDVQYGASGAIDRLAVDFEQRCEGSTEPVYGEFRLNSAIPFSFMRPAGFTTPDDFALVAQNPARAGTLVEAAPISVYGTNAPTSISITGGTYRVNGGPATSAGGMVQPLDRVTVAVQASPVPGEQRQATLTIGGRAATFTVESYRAGMMLSGMFLARHPEWGLPTERLLLTPAGILHAEHYQRQRIDLNLDGIHGYNAYLGLWAPAGDVLRPGLYTSLGNPGNEPGLLGVAQANYFEGGCQVDNRPGRVMIHEAALNQDGTVARFAVDYEIDCGPINGGIRRGQVRVNSAIPFSALAQPAPDSVDLTGDGKADLVFQNTDGRIAAWAMDGTATLATANLIGAGGGWTVTHLADLDGDRKADIFFKHTDGRVYVYRMDGLTVIAGKELFSAGLGWSISHTADLNGDGKADLILRHNDGRAHIWLMDGTAIIGSATLLPASSGWTVVDTGDLNGDGKADIVFAHTDGRGYVYLMNGTVISGSAGFLSQGSGWVVSHAADFDGDGKADLLFKHVDGSAYLFLMNGTAFGAGVSVLGGGTGWSVAHVGDLNGDGKADLVFRHADGRAHARLMNGTAILNAGDILPAASGWSVTQLLDFNGDGKKDLVFRHDNGSITVRLMNGLTTIGSANLIGPGGWSVAP